LEFLEIMDLEKEFW